MEPTEELRDVQALKAAAERAISAGDRRTARALLEEASRQSPGDIGLGMMLAATRRAVGDIAASLVAVDGVLAIDPRHFLALLMRGSLIERLGHAKAAAVAYGIALIQAPAEDRLDEATRRAVAHARQTNERYLADLEASLLHQIRGPRTKASGAHSRRATAFVERAVGKRSVFHQNPVQFNYPGLPEIEFHDREDFPWLEAFEAAAPAITEELLSVLAEDAAGLAPYVNYADGIPLDQWAELNRSAQWSAYHLWYNGVPIDDHARRCPHTMDAVAQLPQPHIEGRSPAAMFSVLRPQTRIPQHTGVANTRLVVHLPLIVPPGCGFRVGGETRAWHPGEAWVFDDTIEHEAWNASDEPRTILICDIWNPLLSESERELITAVMVGMDRFSETATGAEGL